VSGGGTNEAGAFLASVGGGALVNANSFTFEWHAGRTGGFPTAGQY
jgi:hypothetical protein